MAVKEYSGKWLTRALFKHENGDIDTSDWINNREVDVDREWVCHSGLMRYFDIPDEATKIRFWVGPWDKNTLTITKVEDQLMHIQGGQAESIYGNLDIWLTKHHTSGKRTHISIEYK